MGKGRSHGRRIGEGQPRGEGRAQKVECAYVDPPPAQQREDAQLGHDQHAHLRFVFDSNAKTLRERLAAR